ncbi:AAA family ATPase [Solitalea lacus]|uniref:AAA family ATPase n=1 Tax=Solitalea lacus TaxID=2911172 RepID=UPI001EDBB099|nr:SMC family ATPase [Solitalea lacus]UKJ09056.1 SMC family ATPase [Solitalea lacus]
MIPVKLTIKGLYSYQDEQEHFIDFAHLTESQLFGIFGGVGSGKSTILDAITFSVYGALDRLGQSGDNRYFNMMNLKSTTVLIDFEFYNHAGKYYRAIVSGKRGKKFDDVKQFTRVFYLWENNEWIPQEKLNGEEIIGLSYDNFRRTIIIPQGKFQEFLELSNTERTRMLKDIFALEKFEFSDKIARLIAHNNTEKASLEGEMKQFEGLDVSNLQAFEQEISTLKQELECLSIQVNKKTIEHQALIDLKRIVDELEQTKQNFNLHIMQENNILQFQQQLDNYRKAVEIFKAILERKKEKQQELLQKKQRLAQLNQIVLETETRLTEKNAQLSALLPEFEQLQQYKDLSSDYKIAADILAIQSEEVTIVDSLQKGKNYIKEQEVIQTNQKTNSDQLKHHIAKKREQLPDWSLLSKLGAWFNQKAILFQAWQNARTEFLMQERELSSHGQSLSTCLPDSIKSVLLEGSDKPQQIVSKLNGLTENLLQQERELQQLQQDFLVKLKLGEFALQLHNGANCPLCGSSEHPAILNTSDLQLHTDDVNNKLSLLKSQQNSFAVAQTAIAKWESVYEQQTGLLAKQTEKLKAAEMALNDWIQTFSFEGFTADDGDKLQTLIASAEGLNAELKSLEQQKEQADTQLTKTDELLERAKTKINALENQFIALQVRVSEKESQLKHLQLIENKQSAVELISASEQLAIKIKQIETDTERLKADLQLLEQQKAGLSGQFEALQQDHANAEIQFQQIENELSNAVEQSSFENLSKVEAILAQALNIDAIQEQINQFNEKKGSLLSIIERLEKQSLGKTFNTAEFESLTLELQRIKTDWQEKNDNLVRAIAQLNQYLQDFKKKEELQQKFNKLQHRSENLATLSGLFRGSGFVNYVSSIYMQQLCLAANNRFHKLTRQQLHLEVDNQNNFHVRDMLNDGHMRLVKTLSGGQKFQASLCLALALAESVQHFNRSEQSFFFLDEGFGSLDKDSLQIVFEALKSLRKENRIVGLISHVEDLQQEIETHVKIINDPSTGSKIINSWN